METGGKALLVLLNTVEGFLLPALVFGALFLLPLRVTGTGALFTMQSAGL
jgi:hypothetical protein